MSSVKLIRDPKTDHLLTPENFALLVINYQPIFLLSSTGNFQKNKRKGLLRHTCRY